MPSGVKSYGGKQSTDKSNPPVTKVKGPGPSGSPKYGTQKGKETVTSVLKITGTPN